MSGQYKGFPPGWEHLQIPTSSRAAALAGLSLYAPCRPRGIWAHRLAWTILSLLGPSGLPGRASPLALPFRVDVWEALADRWRRELGGFDEVGAYRRLQAERRGWLALLIKAGRPVAFVKVREYASNELDREKTGLALMEQSGPASFYTPRVLCTGELEGWKYLAVEPLPPRPHRPPRLPPIETIAREVCEGLGAGLPKPNGIPAHWTPMHGDLTPWNLRRLFDGSLALLDWEAIGWAPPGADEVLFRITDAAIRDSAPGWADHPEAIDFWIGHLEQRTPSGPRDLRLHLAQLSLLRRMRIAQEAGGAG